VARVDGDSGGIAKPGDIVYSYTQLQASAIGPIGFITPSPVALFLNIAVGAANRALSARSRLAPDKAFRPPTIQPPQLPSLYSYFEECFVCVTTAYQAVEAFANQLLIDSDKEYFLIKRKKKSKVWIEKVPPKQAEIACSIADKLTQALPQATGKELPINHQSYLRFNGLADLRHSIVHLKRIDQYTYGDAAQQTLYYRLLSWNPLASVESALGVIRHFHGIGGSWISGVEAQMTDRSGGI